MLSSPPEQSTATAVARPAEAVLPRRVKAFLISGTALILLFSIPLCHLVRFALHSELYSYILLVPFISAYFLWLQCRLTRKLCPQGLKSGETLISVLLTLIALTGLSLYFSHSRSFLPQDALALTTFSFVSLLTALCMLIFPLSTLKPFTFSLSFLIFMVPFPHFIERAVESGLQHASARAAEAFFVMSGMPVLRVDTEFQLPAFSMQVAPECSGIHSTLVLIIASVVAGYLLLNKSWSRIVFVLAVVPVGILRNAFRIFLLGQLCVRVSPDWINSNLHHKGGPIFFILSLIPFFALLLWLRKREARQQHIITVG